MSIKLFEKNKGWGNEIAALTEFNIVPEIRAYGTISKGFSGNTDGYPTKANHFIVHFKHECTPGTKTDKAFLKNYGIKNDLNLTMLNVSLPALDLAFSTARFKFGKKSGVMCSSDDNLSGYPLMDIKEKDNGKVVLHRGAQQDCIDCPFHHEDDGTCKTTLQAYFILNSVDDTKQAPYLPTQLFKITLPKKARNPFFGDLQLAMGLANTLTLQYGIDQQHFPQSQVPFKLELIERSGQYFNKNTQSQTKTTYYIPVISLDYARMCSRLEKYSDQFNGRLLAKHPEKLEIVQPETLGLPPETVIEDEEEQMLALPEKALQLLEKYSYYKHPAHMLRTLGREDWPDESDKLSWTSCEAELKAHAENRTAEKRRAVSVVGFAFNRMEGSEYNIFDKALMMDASIGEKRYIRKWTESIGKVHNDGSADLKHIKFCFNVREALLSTAYVFPSKYGDMFQDALIENMDKDYPAILEDYGYPRPDCIQSDFELQMVLKAIK